MSLEAGTNISKNEWHSWTIEKGTYFADRFNRLESSTDKVITGFAILIVAAVGLLPFLLADAIRGVSHILESASNWNDRNIEVRSPEGEIPSITPIPVEEKPEKKILKKAKDLKSSVSNEGEISFNKASDADRMRGELANEVLMHIKNMDPDPAVQFVDSVLKKLDKAAKPNGGEESALHGLGFDFSFYFRRKSEEMKHEFINNLADYPLDATNQLLKMNEVLALVTDDKEFILSADDKSIVREKIQSKLALDRNLLSDFVRAVESLEKIGLPKINVEEIFNKINFLNESIEELEKGLKELQDLSSDIFSKLEKLNKIETDSSEIQNKINGQVEEIAKLRILLKEINGANYGTFSGKIEDLERVRLLEKDVKELIEIRNKVDELEKQVAVLNRQIKELEQKKESLMGSDSKGSLFKKGFEIKSQMEENRRKIQKFEEDLRGDLSLVEIPDDESLGKVRSSESSFFSSEHINGVGKLPSSSLLSSSSSDSSLLGSMSKSEEKEEEGGNLEQAVPVEGNSLKDSEEVESVGKTVSKSPVFFLPGTMKLMMDEVYRDQIAEREKAAEGPVEKVAEGAAQGERPRQEENH